MVFPLDARSDFWEAQSCDRLSFPLRPCAGHQARLSQAGFAVSGAWISLQKVDGRVRITIARGASLRGILPTIKRGGTRPCVAPIVSLSEMSPDAKLPRAFG